MGLKVYVSNVSLVGDRISPYLGPHFKKKPQDLNGTVAILILLKYIVLHLKLIEWVQMYMNPLSSLWGDTISLYLGPHFRKEPQDLNGTVATLILVKYIVFHLKLIEWVQKYMNPMSTLEGNHISLYLGPHFKKEPQDFNGTEAP